jgi:hypothetical protein
MADKRPEPADLEKARKIVALHRYFPGRSGAMPEKIARAVAEGIALGRKEGLTMAVNALKRLQDEQ